MISAHNLVTCTLVYLSVGSLIWLVLDGLGIIENSFVEHPQRSSRALVFATVMMIVGWPKFVAAWIIGMRKGLR